MFKMISGGFRLIDYSDTDEEDEKKDIEEEISKNKLPLPAAVKNLFQGTYSIHTDNPNLHDGRIRSFPHERGNWTTLVYVPYEMDEEIYSRICNFTINQCKDIGCFKSCDNLHVSLSRTVVLRHHWIDSFIESLNNRVTSLKRFYVALDHLDVYCNDERTRTFVGLKISEGHDRLMTLVRLVDVCLSEFKLPPFYQNASFHISLIWCLGDKEKELRHVLPRLQQCLIDLEDDVDSWRRAICDITCKTGNRVYSVNLSG